MEEDKGDGMRVVSNSVNNKKQNNNKKKPTKNIEFVDAPEK